MTTTEQPREAEGLLERIAETALDDDYYAVDPVTSPKVRFQSLLTLGVVALFAVMVTITAVQTRNDRPATDFERQTLINDVQTRKKLLASRETVAAALRSDVAELRTSTGRIDPEANLTRTLTGERAAAGEGVQVMIGSGPSDVAGSRITDTDIQLLINGLWYAGAEAISINGNRIGTLSAIRSAGSQITVNYRSIGPPFVIVALGDREAMAQRLPDNPGGQYWEARRRASGLDFTVRTSEALTVPAVPSDRLTLRHAEPVKEESS